MTSPTNIPVTTIDELNAAIETANQADSGKITITFQNDIFLNGTPLEVIDLHPGVTLVIDGGPDGFATLDGGYDGAARGLGGAAPLASAACAGAASA